MDDHAKKVYELASKWLDDNKVDIDHNILEYTCRYHKCSSSLNNNDKYKTLIKLFSEERVKVIMQLILVMNEKPSEINTVWKKYIPYLDALRYAESELVKESV